MTNTDSGSVSSEKEIFFPYVISISKIHTIHKNWFASNTNVPHDPVPATSINNAMRPVIVWKWFDTEPKKICQMTCWQKLWLTRHLLDTGANLDLIFLYSALISNVCASRNKTKYSSKSFGGASNSVTSLAKRVCVKLALCLTLNFLFFLDAYLQST